MRSEPSIGYERGTTVTIRGLLGALRFAVPLIGGAIALVAIAVLLNALFDLDFDAMFWIITGVALALLTRRRPWWFWDHRHAQFLRAILTDRGATVVYLSLALVMVLAGIWRASVVASARRDCTTALATATTSHARLQVLYREGPATLPFSVRSRQYITCERLLERRQ